jgi:hypothetical protein
MPNECSLPSDDCADFQSSENPPDIPPEDIRNVVTLFFSEQDYRYCSNRSCGFLHDGCFKNFNRTVVISNQKMEDPKMIRNQSLHTEFLLMLAIGIILLAPLTACRQQQNIDVTAKTTVSGNVNGSPLEVDILATFNTGRGGSSTCTFTKFPPDFNPATLGTHTWTTHHSAAGLSRFEGDPVVNLYDLTKGNYRIVRTISYPDFPESKIVTDAQVRAVRDTEWDTNITIDGTYNGPTDIVSTKDYQLIWSIDGKNILESGSTTLELSSGGSVRQIWSSTITPDQDFDRFPSSGQLINIHISPFEIEGNSMSYKWEGTVKVKK